MLDAGPLERQVKVSSKSRVTRSAAERAKNSGSIKIEGLTRGEMLALLNALAFRSHDSEVCTDVYRSVREEMQQQWPEVAADAVEGHMSDFKTKFASGYYTEPPPGPDLPPMPLVSWADNESPTDEQWRTFCEARKSWYSRTLPARREHNRQTRAQLDEREREFIHDLAEHIDLPAG